MSDSRQNVSRIPTVDWGREYDRQLEINGQLWDRIWEQRRGIIRWSNAFVVALSLFVIAATVAICEAIT